MGPRLVGRGKVDVPEVAPNSASLQWGRVLWDAESPFARPPWSTRLLASMGPRLVGRGKGDLRQRQALEHQASMGPRLVGRGKPRSPRPCRCGYPCFNGAASCGTRKDGIEALYIDAAR